MGGGGWGWGWVCQAQGCHEPPGQRQSWEGALQACRKPSPPTAHLYRHLMLQNFSAPMSAPKPACAWGLPRAGVWRGRQGAGRTASTTQSACHTTNVPWAALHEGICAANKLRTKSVIVASRAASEAVRLRGGPHLCDDVALGPRQLERNLVGHDAAVAGGDVGKGACKGRRKLAALKRQWRGTGAPHHCLRTGPPMLGPRYLLAHPLELHGPALHALRCAREPIQNLGPLSPSPQPACTSTGVSSNVCMRVGMIASCTGAGRQTPQMEKKGASYGGMQRCLDRAAAMLSRQLQPNLCRKPRHQWASGPNQLQPDGSTAHSRISWQRPTRHGQATAAVSSPPS